MALDDVVFLNASQRVVILVLAQTNKQFFFNGCCSCDVVSFLSFSPFYFRNFSRNCSLPQELSSL